MFENVIFLVVLNGDTIYIAELMRDMAFPFESEEYRLKMEVAEYLKERGMNYWETEIPPTCLITIPKNI